MAVAIRQSVDPSYLLQPAIWQGQGWNVVRRGVLRPILIDPATRAILTPAAVDAYEWTDAQGFGIGNADDGISKLNQALAQRGASLYAYALQRRDVVNFLGVHVWSYRLVLLHNPVIVPIAEFALVILAVTFGALIFIQYITTGHSAVLTDLTQMWGSGVAALGSAVGSAGQGIATPFLWATVFAGVAAIAFATAQKQAGVKARTPTGPSPSVKLKGRHAEAGLR